MGFGKHIFIALFAFCFLMHSAYAACTSPAGSKGEIEYDPGSNLFFYCDDTNWRYMLNPGECSGGPAIYECSEVGTFCSKAGEYYYDSSTQGMVFCDGSFLFNMGPPASGVGGCTSPTGSAGSLIYDGTANVPKFCDGSGWIIIGGLTALSIVNKPDRTPDAFSFPDVNTTQCNKKATSAVVQITGIADGTPVAIDLVNSTAASPQVRNCTTATCAFGSGMPSTSTTVNNNRYLELIGFTGSASSTVTVVVRVGTATATWNIITGVCS